MITKEEIENKTYKKICGRLTRTFTFKVYDWGIIVHIKDHTEGQQNSAFYTRRFTFTDKYKTYDDLMCRIESFYTFKGKYFQPSIYSDDGTNIDWNLPQEMSSFQVFRTKTQLRNCMQHWGYDRKDYIINEYENDDIEDYTLLDDEGCVVEIQECY